MDTFFTLLGGVVFLGMFVISPIVMIYEAFFSYNARRKSRPHRWDFSEVVFYKDMTKEDFLRTYPLYPTGRSYTGFIVDFEDEKSYKVRRITAITNSGIRAIAFNKKEMFESLKNFT